MANLEKKRRLESKIEAKLLEIQVYNVVEEKDLSYNDREERSKIADELLRLQTLYYQDYRNFYHRNI